MSDAPESSHPTRRRLLWRLIAAVAAVLSIPILAFVAFRWSANREIAAEWERIAAAGEPVTLDDLRALAPPLPKELDATAHFLKAFDANNESTIDGPGKDLPYVGLGMDSIPPPGKPWQKLEEAESYLKQNAVVLKELAAAAKQGGQARFTSPETYGTPVEAGSIEFYIKARGAARLLSLDVAVAAHRGDTERVAQDLRSLAAVAESLEGSPHPTSLVVRAALNGMLCYQLEMTLGEVAFTDSQLAELQQLFRDVDYSRQLHDVLLAERVRWMQPEYRRELIPETVVWRWHFSSHVDLTQLMQTMRESCAITAKQAPIETTYAVLLTANRDVVLAFGTANEFFRYRYFMTCAWSGSVLNSAYFVAKSVAECRLADAAIACERYRLANGNWPTEWKHLVPTYLPSAPIDPFTSSEMLFRQRDDIPLIYSVGRNQIDDDGSTSEEQGDDIRIEFHRWRNGKQF